MKNIFSQSIKAVALILCLFVHLMSYALNEEVDALNTGMSLTSDISLTSTMHSEITAAPLTWMSNFGIQSVTNEVSFGINHDIHQVDASYRYRIVFDLSWDEVVSGSLVTTSETGVELELDFSPDMAYQDKEVYTFNGGLNLQVNNIQLFIWDTGVADWVATAVDRENLMFGASIKTEYYETFDYTTPPPYATLSLSISGSNLFVTLPELDGAEAYDLEWTWVNGYTGELDAGVPTVALANAVQYDFATNASRVRIPGNTYSIPLIYGDGYLLVRYRGIGRVLADLTKNVEGKWMTDGVPSGEVNTVNLYPNWCRHTTSAFESNRMNYGASLSFIEDGKRSTMIGYSDGLLKPRQQISQINSQDELLVGSTIYDYYGRPAIIAMGSPVQETELSYIENLNMADLGDPYDKEDFHSDSLMLGNCGPRPAAPMDSEHSQGSAWYYSQFNTHKDGAEAFVPEANGYSFSQIHYTNDPTGRVKRAGTVGPDHQLDASEGHYTEIIFETPGEDEVDELLGSEASSFVNYTKTISRDVHGQVSVSIQDNQGRPVISYLEGSAPAGLESIEGNGPETSIFTDLTAFTSSATDLEEAGILQVEKKISVTDPNQVYTFNYNFDALSFTNCLPPDICFDCVYEIEFEVTPAEGEFNSDCQLTDGADSIPSAWSFTVGSVTAFNLDCEEPLVFSDLHDSTFTLQFPRFGEYYVRKTLKVSEAPMEYYWEQYVANADTNCLLPYASFLASAMSDIDYSECYNGSACELSFYYTYGTWEEYAAETGETDEAVYNALKEDFIADCENAPICAQMRPILLGDVSPGGQYGDISGTSVLSVFNESGGLTLNWKDVIFYNDDGTLSMTTNLDGFEVEVNHESISLEQFIGLWQPQWAASLLPAHPEFETYRFCGIYSDVFDYEITFKTTNTYAEAATLGLITPIDPTLYPSSFGGSPVAFDPTLADPLIKLVNSSLGLKDTLQIPSYIYDDALYPSNDYYQAIQYMITETGGSSFYELATAMSDGAPFGASTCDLDAQWLAFKRLYLSRRNLILQIAMEGRSIEAGVSQIRCIDYTSPMCPVASPYATKTRRFVMFDQLMPYSFIEMASGDPAIIVDLTDDAETATEEFCLESCVSMADEWMYELAGCADLMLSPGETWEVGNATYDAIRADLITVCQGGCSPEWPMPSQYDPDGTGYLVSFDSVIQTYLGGAEVMECNHYLIDFPEPVPNQSLVPSLSTCGCDMLLSVESEEEFEEEFGFIPFDFCLDRQTCADIAEVPIAIAHPVGSINWSGKEALVTAEMSATSYGCGEACIDCSELSTAINQFTSEFPTADIEVDATMFTSYVNEYFGTSFEYYSLISFKQHCDSLDAGGIITEAFSPAAYAFVNYLNVLIDGGGLAESQTVPNSAFTGFIEEISDCPGDGSGHLIHNGTYSGGILYMPMENYLSGTSGANCQTCSANEVILYPVATSLAGSIYAGNPNAAMDNIIEFSTLFMTADDIAAYPGLDQFHVIATVADSSGGDPFKMEFQIISRTCLEFIELLNALCNDLAPATEDDCIDALVASAEATAKAEYGEYLATKKEEFMADYITTCSAVEETYSYEYQANRYHYTLFFYDVAGNLVKTVPPKGVTPLTEAEIDQVQAHRSEVPGVLPVIADHKFVSHYTYNGLNQLIETKTPDGGKSQFWYDQYGRLVASQNARQAVLTSNVIDGDPLNPVFIELPAYSYTLFDDIGRPIEFGEIVQPTPLTSTITKDATTWNAWMNELTDGTIKRYRNQVTQINYSTPTDAAVITAMNATDQGDIRNRISSVQVIEDYVEMDVAGWSFPTADYQNHYRYDVHGNVVSYIQDIPDLAGDNRQFLRTDYEFDLLSGIPHYVHFQPGEVDQYSHHYVYDADNRLKEVYTSKDGTIWDRDAEYTYRLDGKRVRTELGETSVQGLDYAYTLHGWLKALNSGILNPEKDMGNDGLHLGETLASMNSHVAEDALAFTLGYFENDYKSIDTDLSNDFLPVLSGDIAADIQPLYNGNITSVTTAMRDLDEERMDVTATAYTFDQLHRFKESHVFTSSDITELNSFVNASRQHLAAGTHNTLGDNEVHVDYDQNGNITRLDRRAKQEGAGTNFMDEFTYHYPSTSNRLSFVEDAISGTSFGDIQSGQELFADSNYQYHPDGSLMKDLQEEIAYVDWYPNGRVKQIIRTPESVQSDLYFEYGPMGNRILKVEKTKDVSGALNPESQWNSTWYAIDANGTTLAHYKKTETDPGLIRSDAMIFGASRLGLDTRPVSVSEEIFTFDDFTEGTPCTTAGEWFKSAGTSHTLDDVNLDGSTDINFANTANYYVSLNINTIVGETYTVSYDILEQSIGWVYARAKSCPGAGSVLGMHNASGVGSYTYNFVASSDITKIMWFGQSIPVGGGSFTLGNLSISGEGDIYGDFDTELVVNPYRILGEKMYELGDHLGNVKEVITDRKMIYEKAGNMLDDFTFGNPCIDAGNWFLSSGTTHTLSDLNADGATDLKLDNTANYYASLNINTIIGETYTVSYDILNQTTAWVYGRAKTCPGAGTVVGLHNSSSAGSYSYTFVATTAMTKVQWHGQGIPPGGGSFTLSNIVISGAGDILGTGGSSALAYLPDVVSYSDYYPYGMEMPNRKGSLTDYRYAFNGMETDNEVSGEGNSYTTMFRQYDPRLGRWKSLDPLMVKFPWQSPYNGMDDNPITLVDPLGLSTQGGGNPLNHGVDPEETKPQKSSTEGRPVSLDIIIVNKDGSTTVLDLFMFDQNNFNVADQIPSFLRSNEMADPLSVDELGEHTTVIWDAETEEIIKVSTSKVANVVHYEPIVVEEVEENSWFYDEFLAPGALEGNGPFESADLHVKASLAIGAGFSIEQTVGFREYGGGDETFYQAKLTWSTSGGTTGFFAGFSGQWESEKTKEAGIDLVAKGGMKYKCFFFTASNQSLDIEAGIYKKSLVKDKMVKPFLRGLTGLKLNKSVILEAGFEIDITQYMLDDMTEEELFEAIRPQIEEAFMLMQEYIDTNFSE